MSYTLSFKDRYLRVAESKVLSDTSLSQQFYFIPDEEEQLIRTKWTGKQWHKLLSCIETGADLMFPDEANEIIWQFIKTITTPPETPSENECFEYKPSANFIHYFPDNPYVIGDPAFGWYKEAWWRFLDFDTWFPDWVDNWIAGNAAYLLGYLPTDVLFNIESLIAPNILAFLNDGGVLPKIRIDLVGSGEINLTLLSFPLGGKAIIELDEEPNVLDILTGGVLDPNAFMVELNRDILSFPPDEYPIVTIPITVDTPGAHSLYINFIPVIDDAAFPLLFGGGIRGIELCGFGEQGTMGIEQIIWDGCALKSISGEVETVIVTAEQIQDCLDIPPGGGGGLAGIKATTYGFEISGGNQDTTSTTMVQAAGTVQAHQFTYENALIFAEAQVLNTNAANNVFIEVRIGPTQSSPNAVQRLGGNAPEVLYISGSFSGLDTTNPSNINLYFRANATTARIATGARIVYTILEYADAADLDFLEDVRYQDGVLQKKIGGVWFDVVDIQALLDPIQAQASSALSTATAAQSAAANALSVATTAHNTNSSQNVVIADHESRLDSLETLDIPQINLTLGNHESRIDALEAASGAAASQEAWAKEWDLLSSANGWTSPTASWVSGQGFVMNGAARLQYLGVTLFDNRVTHAKFDVRRENGGFGTMTIEYANSDGFAVVRMSGGGLLTNQWVKVPNNENQPTTLDFLFSNFDGNVRLQKIKVLGRGTNLFP